jgi:hypothetical protein
VPPTRFERAHTAPECRSRLGAAPLTYRVEFGGGAQVQFHGLPQDARDAQVERAADLADEPWDAVVLPPGDYPAFRETVFGSGQGILAFHVDDSARLIAFSTLSGSADSAARWTSRLMNMRRTFEPGRGTAAFRWRQLLSTVGLGIYLSTAVNRGQWLSRRVSARPAVA